ncbi:MAG: putative metal-binding motif-containing protein, partial [Myxococcota bacterium]|nr:putative metal-binding motif-containing protein [Myxococcota bacterium]
MRLVMQFSRRSGDRGRRGCGVRAPLLVALWMLAACDCSGGLTMSGGGGGAPCRTSADCERGMCVDGRCVAPRTDGGGSEGCRVDEDGDGFGEGCVRGPDCDDANPVQTGVEVCDAADNDCDGEVDEGVRSACGDCDPTCRAGGSGVGTDRPFDPGRDESEGVGLDPEGALVLDSRRVVTHFIWIANSGEGTVSKVDTRTFVEVARYITGPAGRGNDPSRTSVNTEGDVYVGNRSGRSLTKISVLGPD